MSNLCIRTLTIRISATGIRTSKLFMAVERHRFCSLVLFCTAAVTFVPPATAQQSARITVHVIADTIPVSGAVVRSAGLSARTDEHGDATLTVAPGSLLITINKIGFHPDTALVELESARDTSLTMTLLSEPVKIGPLVVMTTRVDRRIEDEPLRVEVLSGDDVGEKSEMRPGDSRTLLSELSGVRMQSLTPLGAMSIRIHGLPGRYTAFLRDGLPLYGAQPSGFTLVEMPPLDIRQAEVIKGAASALYGSQALAGVVNLISRGADDTTQLLLNQSSPSASDAIAFIARPMRLRGGFTAIGGIHRQTEQDRDADGWSEVPGMRRAELRPRLFFDDNLGHTAMLTVGGVAEDRGSGSRTFRDSLSTRHADVGLVVRYRIAQSVVITARGSATRETKRHVYGTVVEDDDRGTVFGEVTGIHNTRLNTAVAGVALLNDSYSNKQVSRFNAAYSTPGLFFQDTYAPLTWASATGNVRCDRSNFYGTICSPRVSFLSRFGRSVSARMSVGAGWFSPRPLTEETEAFGLSRVLILVPLKPERGRTASFDVTMTRGDFQVNGTLFSDRVLDPLALRSVAGDSTGMVNLVNAGGPLRTHGGEVFAVFDQEPVIVTAYLAATRGKEQSADSDRSREMPLVPREEGGLDFAVVDDDSGSYAAIETFYTGRQALEDNPFATISRPYTTVGVLVSKRWNGMTVFLNADNLTAVRLTNYHPLLRSRIGKGGSWTIVPWAPLEGRRINAGIRLSTQLH